MLIQESKTQVSFILVPKHGDDIYINGWNWRPTLEILSAANLVNEENCERMGANGAGGEVNEELALRIADLISHRLNEMKPGMRVLAT